MARNGLSLADVPLRNYSLALRLAKLWSALLTCVNYFSLQTGNISHKRFLNGMRYINPRFTYLLTYLKDISGIRSIQTQTTSSHANRQ